MKQLTIEDIVYLAKDDPLAARERLESLIKNTESYSYGRGQRHGMELGSLFRDIATYVGIFGLIFAVIFGAWKIYDNRCLAYEQLLVKELEACKAGNTAECLAATTRANEDREINRRALYAQVYYDKTQKPLPGLPDLVKDRFVDLKYDANGNLVIDLATSKRLIIEADPK